MKALVVEGIFPYSLVSPVRDLMEKRNSDKVDRNREETVKEIEKTLKMKDTTDKTKRLQNQTLKYFLESVNSMEGDTIFHENNKEYIMIDENTPPKNIIRSVAYYCSDHNINDCLAFRLKMKQWIDVKTKESWDIPFEEWCDRYIPERLHLPSINHRHFNTGDPEKNSSVTKKRVPIFDCFFSNVRRGTTRSLSFYGDQMRKEKIECVCCGCQTEKFFCTLYYDETACEKTKKTTGGDDVYLSISKNKKRKNDFQAKETKDERYKRFKKEENDFSIETLPSEILKEHILQSLWIDELTRGLRSFDSEIDAQGSMVSYLSVKKRNALDRSNWEDEFANIFDTTRENKMILTNAKDILRTLSTLSHVCKEWNSYCKKHWIWRIFFQCAHTLYNSDGDWTVRTRRLDEMRRTFPSELSHGFFRVHGIFDCHVYASYTSNFLSNICFEILNSSKNMVETEAKLQEKRFYHSMMRLLCCDTFRGWKEGKKKYKSEKTVEHVFILDECITTLQEIIDSTRYQTEERKKRIYNEWKRTLFFIEMEEKDFKPTR